MTYEELQAKAKSLGIKYVGVGKKQLEKNVAQAEANQKASNESDSKEKDANTAIVLDSGGQEVRRYELSVHGEDFVKLAKGFANDREYTVQFKKVKPGVPCPSCGYMIRPEGE